MLVAKGLFNADEWFLHKLFDQLLESHFYFVLYFHNFMNSKTKINRSKTEKVSFRRIANKAKIAESFFEEIYDSFVSKCWKDELFIQLLLEAAWR